MKMTQLNEYLVNNINDLGKMKVKSNFRRVKYGTMVDYEWIFLTEDLKTVMSMTQKYQYYLGGWHNFNDLLEQYVGTTEKYVMIVYAEDEQRFYLDCFNKNDRTTEREQELSLIEFIRFASIPKTILRKH